MYGRWNSRLGQAHASLRRTQIIKGQAISFTSMSAMRMCIRWRYLADWDSTLRTNTITISDARTGVVYDTETFGLLKWRMVGVGCEGKFEFHSNSDGGRSAAVSGVFPS